jgi:hypothetical protein
MSQSTNKSSTFVAPGYVDIDNLGHAPDLAAALGNMVVAWARAETAIVKAYAVVTEMHYNVAAAAYYNIPTFESRTKALLAMIQDKPDPFPKRDEFVTIRPGPQGSSG